MAGGHYVHKKCGLCGKMMRDAYKEDGDLVCYQCHRPSERNNSRRERMLNEKEKDE